MWVRACDRGTAVDLARAPVSSQDETSEAFIGEWMEERKIRDQIVVSTKVGVLLSVSCKPS